MSLMAQFVPSGQLKHTPPFDRTVTREEYEAVVDWLYMLGLEDGFLQEHQRRNRRIFTGFFSGGCVT